MNSDRKFPAARDTLGDDVGSFYTTLLELFTCSFDERCNEASIPTGVNYENAEVGAYILYCGFDQFQ